MIGQARGAHTGTAAYVRQRKNPLLRLFKMTKAGGSLGKYPQVKYIFRQACNRKTLTTCGMTYIGSHTSETTSNAGQDRFTSILSVLELRIGGRRYYKTRKCAAWLVESLWLSLQKRNSAIMEKLTYEFRALYRPTMAWCIQRQISPTPEHNWA